MVDKEKAVELRKQGLTYKQIAEEIGCSEVWCKKNLASVVMDKEAEDAEILEKCLMIAKTNRGITTQQILKLAMKKEDYDMTATALKEHKKAILRKYKTKIKAAEGIVRPQWMVPEAANASFRKMLDLVNELDERMYESVLEFREEFGLDASYDKAILYGLSQMSYASYSFGNVDIERLAHRLSSIANELEKRNSGKFSAPKRINVPILPDFSKDEEFIC